MTKAKPKTYLVFIDNSGFDSETVVKRMTGWQLRKEVGRDQCGIAIVDGDLIKGFDSQKIMIVTQ